MKAKELISIIAPYPEMTIGVRVFNDEEEDYGPRHEINGAVIYLEDDGEVGAIHLELG